MKHPQHILAVEAQPFIDELDLQEGFNRVDEGKFFRVAHKYLVVALREVLDNELTTPEMVSKKLLFLAQQHGVNFTFNVPDFDPYKGDRTKLQLLPYRYMVKQADDKTEFSVYQRGKGVGESRLAGNDSVGYGGHVDAADLIYEVNDLESTSVVNLSATLAMAAKREFREEVLLTEELEYEDDMSLDLTDEVEFTFMGLILDRSNDVGKLHLGLVYRAELPVRITACPAEEELLARPPMTAEEILNDNKAESWTRILVGHELANSAIKQLFHDASSEKEVNRLAFLRDALSPQLEGFIANTTRAGEPCPSKEELVAYAHRWMADI